MALNPPEPKLGWDPLGIPSLADIEAMGDRLLDRFEQIVAALDGWTVEIPGFSIRLSKPANVATDKKS